MIETQTVAGPIALARAFAAAPAADLPAAPRPDPFRAPDPVAPFGPAPTFKVTFLERVWEERKWPGPRPPEQGSAFGALPLARGAAAAVDLRV